MGCFLAKPASNEVEEQQQPAAPSSPTSSTDAPAWPPWLAAAAGDALRGWSPRRPDSFQKLDKIGSGTYSNVYKAREVETGEAVALKKVRVDGGDAEAAGFMAREVAVLRRLGSHPNVVHLRGIATSRVSRHSLYLVFEYMDHDLAGLLSAAAAAASAAGDGQGQPFTLPQVKCYMKQLLTGLEHCHNRGILHRDIKGSNLLLDNQGNLKIADFGLASVFDPDHKRPMTNRVVTLWYRPPELLLGATHYGVGVDLWSAGCILAELLSGKPILPGRTEVEQLHRIFKLCGTPSEEYWKKSKLPHKAMFKPRQPYKRCVAETFKDLPPPALSLIETLLAIDPAERGTATAALNSEFFMTEPFACEPSSLPQYPPSKEMDARLKEEKAKRQKMRNGKEKGRGTREGPAHNRYTRAIPAPEANAELQVNLDFQRRRLMARVNVTSTSEKFPPPHQDAVVGVSSTSFIAQDASFASFIFDGRRDSAESQVKSQKNSVRNNAGSKKASRERPPVDNPSNALVKALKPSSVIKIPMELKGNVRIQKRVRGKELEVFNGGKS